MMEIGNLLHKNTVRPDRWLTGTFLVALQPGYLSKDVFWWDEDDGEFYNNVTHHLPLDEVYGWVYISEFEDALFKKMNGDVIEAAGGFKVGDKVRLADGDGRPHIIKEFIEEEGLHSLNFYRVIFEDNTASDHIFPGQPYRTSMVKIEDK